MNELALSIEGHPLLRIEAAIPQPGHDTGGLKRGTDYDIGQLHCRAGFGVHLTYFGASVDIEAGDLGLAKLDFAVMVDEPAQKS